MTNSKTIVNHHPPESLLCPVTGQLLVDPVLIRATCCHTVSRECFMDWLREGNQTCPLCQAPLKALYAKTNQETKKKVQTFLLEHQSSSSPNEEGEVLRTTTAAAASNIDKAQENKNNKTTKNKAVRRDALKVNPEFQLEIQLEAYCYARHVVAVEEEECCNLECFHHHHPPPVSPRPIMAEKETSHSTLETMEMSSNHSAQTYLDDSIQDHLIMDDWSGRVRRRDSPNNWEDSCASISNIRIRSSAMIATTTTPSSHHQNARTSVATTPQAADTNSPTQCSGGKPCILSYKVTPTRSPNGGGHSPTRSPNHHHHQQQPQQERNRPIQRLLNVMNPSTKTTPSRKSPTTGTTSTTTGGYHHNQIVKKKKNTRALTTTTTGKSSILIQQLRLPFGSGS